MTGAQGGRLVRSRVNWPLLARKVHKWLALFVGIQVVLWTVTGMYMVSVHIDRIHGDHLVKRVSSEPFNLRQVVSPDKVVKAYPEARDVRLQRLLGQPVWRVGTGEQAFIVRGMTGQRLPPLNEEQARAVARNLFAGDAEIVSARLLTESPLEVQARKPPLWQIQFEGWDRPTLYISPTTGELLARRHALWRVFDFAWMLHIMDYDERTDVNNPLLRVATWSAVVMALSGAWLLFWSFGRRKRKKA